MMKQTIYNDSKTYSYVTNADAEKTEIPEKAVFAAVEGEYIVPTLLPKEYSSVDEILAKIDETDLAIIEEIGRSKFLNSLQIYELLSLRGISINRNNLRKKTMKLMRYRVIRESVIMAPKVEKGIRYYEVEGKGFVIARERGVLFHSGNSYMSYAKRLEQDKIDTPSSVKRILAGNMVVINALKNGVRMLRFGINETFLVENEDGCVIDGAILRVPATIKIDDNSVLAYEVVRNTPDALEKLTDKVERYYSLLHNERYLFSNHHGDTNVFPQLIICGESLEHNKKIANYLRTMDLWREEDPILFTEDLLNIRDSVKSIYELKDEERIWYLLPLVNENDEERRETA